MPLAARLLHGLGLWIIGAVSHAFGNIDTKLAGDTPFQAVSNWAQPVGDLVNKVIGNAQSLSEGAIGKAFIFHPLFERCSHGSSLGYRQLSRLYSPDRQLSTSGREVFVSAVTRRALRAYLRMRSDDKPLFLTHGTGGEHRITYDGLRSAIESRADKARIAPPQLHAFRRTFAITSWRNGVDVTAIARMMGHGSLPVVMRYIAAETSDLAAIHDEHAPTGNL